MGIDRREFFGLTAAGIAAAVSGTDAAAEMPIELTAAEPLLRNQNLTIRDYLSREAQIITSGVLRGLKDSEAFYKLIPERRRQYMEMMGLDALAAASARTPVPVHVTGVIDRPAYKIEKLHYESL